MSFIGPLTTATHRLLVGYVDPLFGLFSLVASVWIFYIIGKRADFKRRPLTFVATSFIGALVGSAVDYYVFAPLAGQGWETGFGYVTTWGTGELTSFLTVLTAAGTSFMIPVAGLALSSLRRNSPESVQSANVGTPSYRSFLVSVFVIAALALPVSGEVYQALGHLAPGAGSVIVESSDPWRSLVSGYISLLVYPTLLITTYYFLGKGRTMSWGDVPDFGLRVFAAGVGGLLAGLIVSVGIESGWGVLPSFLLSNLPVHLTLLTVNGAFILALGFASASLGIVRGGGSGGMEKASYGRRNLLSMLATVLLATVVAIAGMATYAYALNPALASSEYSCSYQPGNVLYLRVVSDQGGTPVAGASVSGVLVCLCPVVFSCSGPCNPLFQTSTITKRGDWSFVTNASGYVTVSSSLLGGSGFWFTLTSAGHNYLARYQICAGGTTDGRLSLPSGAISGKEIPGINMSVVSSAILGQSGTEYISGCSATTFSGNATVS